jgi:hypothetical protein
MIDEFTVYDTRTGFVLRTGTCPTGQWRAQATQSHERAVIGTWKHDEYWFDGFEVKCRANAELSVSGTTVTGIPPGAMLFCDGKEYGPVDDGIAEFEFNLPGEYVVRIHAPSHKDCSVTLVAP